MYESQSRKGPRPYRQDEPRPPRQGCRAGSLECGALVGPLADAPSGCNPAHAVPQLAARAKMRTSCPDCGSPEGHSATRRPGVAVDRIVIPTPRARPGTSGRYGRGLCGNWRFIHGRSCMSAVGHHQPWAERAPRCATGCESRRGHADARSAAVVPPTAPRAVSMAQWIARWPKGSARAHSARGR